VLFLMTIYYTGGYVNSISINPTTHLSTKQRDTNILTKMTCGHKV
jgi:hypothetical protein